MPDNLAERLRLLIALGQEQRRAGQLEVARKTLEAVVQLARGTANPETFAHTALGLHALGDSLDSGREPVDLLDDAAAWLVATMPGGTALRARVAALANHLRCTVSMGSSCCYQPLAPITWLM